MTNKTLYIWDLAETLFNEVWNQKLTGFNSYEAWLENKLGKKVKDMTAREFEQGYEIPYKNGAYFNLDVKPGFQEVLSSFKNNEVFTTGTPEQMNWRAEYLNPRLGFDVRKYFRKIGTTFDYGETNIKTRAMLVAYLTDKYNQGFKTVVYADDKEKNCQVFLEAAEEIKERHEDFSYRIYHVLNNDSGLQKGENYYTIGSLFDSLENENKIK